MAAHRGSWAAVAPLGEQALQAALSERCARFQPSPYASDAVAFTHLPKAGGSSYQRLLRESGAGKRICNVHDLPLAELAASQQAGRRFTGTADCDVLIGHANIALEEHGLEWRGRSAGTFVTLFRQPSARAESLFRYRGGRGQEFASAVIARNGSLQHEYEQFLAQQAPTMQAAWLHSPLDVFPPGADLSTWGRPSAAGSTAMTTQQIGRVLAFIARRYSAVGVLERSAETAEVLRCRLPWVNATRLPHVEANSQTWTYPVTLVAQAELLQKHTAVEQYLYEWANLLLSKDLDCCRSPPRRTQPHSSSAPKVLLAV